jgi:branched-subunit amino acid aminotransferase/4-amino-4-deoxychorismate lyase
LTSMDIEFDGYQHRTAELQRSTNPLAKGLAWVEGAIVPLQEARIPLLDQGFLHSDLTYDVPAVWNGRYFRLDDHLDRLFQSCRKLRLNSPMSRAVMRETLIDMVARSGIRDAFVQMIVTRGLRFVRQLSLEGNLDAAVGNVYLMVLPYVWVMAPDMQRRGGSAIVTRTVRRTPPGAMDPTVKNLQWGDFVRGLFEAADRHALYPFLPDGDGNITEGSGFNIFMVKDRTIQTPRLGVLEGVTRRTILEIAESRGWPSSVGEVPVNDLYNCDEIFMATTAGGVMPITELDGQPVGGGQVGPVTRQIWEAYWDAHQDPKLSFAVNYA